MAELGGGAKCIKCLMVFFNAIFFLTGGALCGLGIYVLVDNSALGFIDGVLESPLEDPMFATALYIVTGVGAFVFLLGALGFCGACCNKTGLLCAYIVLVSIVLVVELAAGVLFILFKEEIDDFIEDEMKKSLMNMYGKKDDDDNDLPTTASWNELQKEFKCCGVNSHQDYIYSYWYNSSAENTENSVPSSCCADEDEVTLEACYNDAQIDQNNSTSDALFTAGCYDELKSWVDDNLTIILAVVFTFLALQVFGLVFACILRGAITEVKIV